MLTVNHQLKSEMKAQDQIISKSLKSTAERCRKYREKKKMEKKLPLTSTERSIKFRSMDENRKKQNEGNKERKRRNQQDSTVDFPLETDEFYKPGITKRALELARTREKTKYLQPGPVIEESFEAECRRGFKEHILFELRYTRFENKAIKCCSWMMSEINVGKVKMKSMLDDLLQRRVHAIKKKESFIWSALDERIKEEGIFLYTNLYAKFGLCYSLVRALKRWGIRSLPVSKLVLDLLAYMYANTIKVDVISHLLNAGCLETFQSVRKFWTTSMTEKNKTDVLHILKVSEHLHRRVIFHRDQ
jgi:hypothetical protein